MNMTYATLVASIKSWSERSDEAFTSQVPSFINLAENRLATDMKQQGFQTVVTGVFDGSNVQAKPAFWRETISFAVFDDNVWKDNLELRSLEYIRQYWPSTAMQGQPRFYADYNTNNFYVAPTPPAGTPFELVFYARLDPLTPENQQNWLTMNAPQAILAAAMIESSKFRKNDADLTRWNQDYATAIAGLISENGERLADRNTVVARP